MKHIKNNWLVILALVYFGGQMIRWGINDFHISPAPISTVEVNMRPGLKSGAVEKNARVGMAHIMNRPARFEERGVVVGADIIAPKTPKGNVP